MSKGQRWTAAVTLWVVGVVAFLNGMSNEESSWLIGGLVAIGAGVFALFMKPRGDGAP